jgi:hypothetical protein
MWISPETAGAFWKALVDNAHNSDRRTPDADATGLALRLQDCARVFNTALHHDILRAGEAAVV